MKYFLIRLFSNIYKKKCIRKIETRPEIGLLKELVERLRKKFPECKFFLHGGAIRDILIDEIPNDYDILIVKKNAGNRLTYEVNQYLKKYSNPKIFAIDSQFFSCELINFVYKNICVEFVCSDSLDNYVYGTNLTVNAVYYDMVTNKVYDPQKGLTDILLKKIQFSEWEEKNWKEEINLATFLKIVSLWKKNGFNPDKQSTFILMKNKKNILKMIKEMSMLNQSHEKDYLKKKNIQIVKNKFPLSLYIDFFDKLSTN